MTDSDRTAVSLLVGDLGEFAARHWGRKPLLRRSGLDASALLGLADVDALLAAGARRPTFRLVRDGRTLPASRSTSNTRLGGRVLDDVADAAKIGREVAAGATLVLQALQRTWPPIAELCDRIERVASHPVQANAYLTPAEAAGLRRHRDEHDVLVVQLEGTKAWDVDGLGRVQMTPNHVLYLPAGTAHAAEAVDSHSLHLTIGFIRVTHRSALRRAIDSLDDERLDRPLPFGYAQPGARGRLRDGLGMAFALASDALASGADVAADAEARRVGAPRRTGDGDIARALAGRRLDGDDHIRLRPDVAATLDAGRDDGRCAITLADRRIVVPPAMRPAVEAVLAGGGIKVDDLPGLDEGSRVVLARRLAREGVVELFDV